MAHTIPDNDVASATDQARWFQTDVDILAAGYGATGVISGCGVTQQGTPDMTVAVAAGTILAAGAQVAVASGNLTIGAAHATLKRLDLISASSVGTKTITAGTAATSPKPPALPAGNIGLAFVYIAPLATTIVTASITDKRVILPNPTPVSIVTGDTTLTVADNGRTVILNSASTHTVNLPAATFGLRFSVANQQVPGSGNGVTVHPAGTDVMRGNNFTESAGKGAVNTQATAKVGDAITVVSDGAGAWTIISLVGVWAREA
jgi:hypothetical protein